jgi:SAM-dependent methyltransferase
MPMAVVSGLRQIARTLRVRQIAWDFRWKKLNKIGGRRQCYMCSRRFRQFYPFRRGIESIPHLIRQLAIVGSDVVNYGCPFCYSNDRERHLFLYFDRLKLWETLRNTSVLHFAPERHLAERIQACGPRSYLRVDLYPLDSEIQRVDIMDIPFSERTFDFVICNHVLEHAADDRRALSEIYRVLKPGGRAVLQTPYSTILVQTFEDPGIATEQLRLEAYGQEDHVRLYGMDFLDRLQAAGLQLKLCRHDDVATTSEAHYYGMNPKEDLILVEKSQQES